MKWEYLRIHMLLIEHQRDSGKVFVILSNGVEVFRNSKNPTTIHDYLNELGKDGWELVSVLKTSDNSFDGQRYDIYLKRVLQD